MWRGTLSALLFASVSSLSYGSQFPLSSNVHTTSTTLVDLLSADPDYLQLLRLLQRTRLIPTLNRLNGTTFFAPTNDAVKRYSLWDDFLAIPDDHPSFSNEYEPIGSSVDNINEKVRQTLLYHILNYTLPSFPPQESEIATYNTLHFPRIPVSPPSKHPPPAPPWIPVPGGSLNNESQRLRAALRSSSSSSSFEPTAYINVDAWGEGGTPVVKPAVQGTDCLLVGINDVLEPPPSLAAILRNTPALSYLSYLLPESVMNDMANSPGLTVFLPEDDAWGDLHPVVKKYLEGPFATRDLRWIAGMHMAEGALGYSDRFGDVTKSTRFFFLLLPFCNFLLLWQFAR